jgi:hypothetical protein
LNSLERFSGNSHPPSTRDFRQHDICWQFPGRSG